MSARAVNIPQSRSAVGRALAILGLSAAVLSSPSVAGAQGAEPSAEEQEARARFEAGQLAYESGRFEDALQDFERAYALSGRVQLLYNIGLAADRLRRDQEALEAYGGFVEALPEHPRAAWVRERIDALVASAQAAAPAAPQTPVGSGPNLGAWLFGGAGFVMSGVGATLLALALSDRNAIESLTSPQPWPDLQRRADTVTRRSGIGIALLGVGLAASLGALLWGVLGRPDDPVRASIGPGSLLVEGRF